MLCAYQKGYIPQGHCQFTKGSINLLPHEVLICPWYLEGGGGQSESAGSLTCAKRGTVSQQKVWYIPRGHSEPAESLIHTRGNSESAGSLICTRRERWVSRKFDTYQERHSESAGSLIHTRRGTVSQQEVWYIPGEAQLVSRTFDTYQGEQWVSRKFDTYQEGHNKLVGSLIHNRRGTVSRQEVWYIPGGALWASRKFACIGISLV